MVGSTPLEIQLGQQSAKGHGRVEIRQIKVSSELNQYADWAGLAQVFELKREWWRKGIWYSETHFGTTSLPAEVADPVRLLQLRREHWGIENKLQWVKDEVLGEDQSTTHLENGPQVVGVIRNTVLSLLRRAGHHHISQALRANSSNPHRALAFMGISFPSA